MIDIRYLWKSIKRKLLPALLVYGAAFIALCVSCYAISQNTYISYQIQIWDYGCEAVDLFLPLIVVLPFVFPFYMLRKNSFVEYAGVRMGRRKYLLHQMLSGLVLTFVLTFLMYYLALFFSMFLDPGEYGSSKDFLKNIFGEYQVNAPLVFGFFWCMWKGFVASLFTLFSYFLALYIDNVFIATLLPFLYVMVENLATALLQIPQASIVTTFVLNRLSPSCMTVWNYGIGVVTFALIGTMIILIARGRRRGEYEQ